MRWEHTDLPLYANGYTHISGPLVVVSRGVSGETFDLRSGEGGPPPPSTIPTGTIAVNRPGATLPADLRTVAIWDAAAVAGDDGVAFDASSANGELVGFDPDTGERRWTFALDRPSHSNLHLQDGIVVVSTGDTPPGGCP